MALSSVPLEETPDQLGAYPRLSDDQLGALALDEKGFVLTGLAAARAAGEPRECMLLETSLPGVLAAGDVRSGSIKRVVSAVGEGAMAVRLVHEHFAAVGRPPGQA